MKREQDKGKEKKREEEGGRQRKREEERGRERKEMKKEKERRRKQKREKENLAIGLKQNLKSRYFSVYLEILILKIFREAQKNLN